jgi:hypothetical protein
MQMNRSVRTWAAIAVLAAAAATARASTWGGHMGTIHLSFSPGPEFTHVATAEALPKVGAIVDLYALLADMPPVVYRGERFLSLGGYELQLKVDGAEWNILETNLPEPCMSVGQAKGCLWVGKFDGIEFVDGGARLAHWRIQVLGEARNVVFGLDPAGVNSCATLEGCPDSGTQAVWTGSGVANQVGLVFSAGYVPAYLNWEGGEPDLTPVRGKVDWQDIGLVTLEE